MKKIFFVLALILSISSCEKEPKANFENRDYYKGNDEIMHGYSSPCLDYLILEFNNGVVEFSEAYHDPTSSKRWSKKGFATFGDTSKNSHFPIKHKGTYERQGDEIIIRGLRGENYVDHSVEFTKAIIKGEKAGTVNIDVYYKADFSYRKEEGKINFIGMEY